MKKFAVAYINFFENNVQVEIIEAETWEGAVKRLGAFKGEGEGDESLNDVLSLGLEGAKYEAFNGEWGFDVKEIL